MPGLIPDWAADAIAEEVASAPEWSPDTEARLYLIIHGSSMPVTAPGEAA